MEGLIELCSAVEPCRSTSGEFIYSIADFADYIKYGTLWSVVRLIADNVGGISGSMRVGLLADAHGLECTPHNWGNPFGYGACISTWNWHFPTSTGSRCRSPLNMPTAPTISYKFRPNEEGYVPGADPGSGTWAIPSIAMRWTRSPSESIADVAVGERDHKKEEASMFRCRLVQCVSRLVLCVLLLMVIFPASALERPEITFKIFQFPAEHDSAHQRQRRMTGPWCRTVMPSAWTNWKTPKRRAGMAPNRDPKDLDVKVKVGWVKGLNRLYFLYQALQGILGLLAPRSAQRHLRSCGGRRPLRRPADR
jgi:hypothetical protein